MISQRFIARPCTNVVSCTVQQRVASGWQMRECLYWKRHRPSPETRIVQRVFPSRRLQSLPVSSLCPFCLYGAEAGADAAPAPAPRCC